MISDQNKPFYIIRRYPPGAGFFSNFFYVLGHMALADDNNLIPIVDMLHYPTLYNETHPIHHSNNAWEYYFKQVDDFTLDEAYQSNRTILSNFQFQFHKVYYGNEHVTPQLPSKLTVDMLNQYITKYITLQPDILNILSEWESKLKTYKKVLGVHLRGTDMNYTPEHPKQPTPQAMLIEAQRLIKDYDIDGIFVCSDEQLGIDLFRQQFGEKVISTNAFRATDNTHVGIHVNPNNTLQRENHRYLLGQEVLIDTLLLSKCNMLLCGNSNIVFGAYVFNNHQYEKVILLSGN